MNNRNQFIRFDGAVMRARCRVREQRGKNRFASSPTGASWVRCRRMTVRDEGLGGRFLEAVRLFGNGVEQPDGQENKDEHELGRSAKRRAVSWGLIEFGSWTAGVIGRFRG